MSVVTILPDCKHGLKTNVNSTPSNSLKSMDTVYTSSSSKFSALNRRKVNQRHRERNPSLVPAVSEIKQRVISARLLRMKQMQNQIGEAHHRLAELTAENRLLKSVHKRQDSALSKYESSSAELPKLLHSHAEEVRVWQTRCRNLQRQNKELMGKIKKKDDIIFHITDQNKHLLQLNKDKNLEEREKLADRVKDLEQRLIDKDNDMKLLARRLQLESKAYRSNLNVEQQKYRDLLAKIDLSEYVLQRNEGDKKSPKQLMIRQNNRVKSPTRPTSKSATNLVGGNEKETLILPPCDEAEAKKPEEAVKTNSPRIATNTKVKMIPTSQTDDEENDVTTKSNAEKAVNLLNGQNNHKSDDEIQVTIRNGYNRVRVQQKPTKSLDKLTPLHPKKDTKKSSDDSESDGDFQLFSEHNGTKMAHNARDLLEHKMHLSELESKMKQNSLKPSSSSSSLSENQTIKAPVHSYNDRGDNEFTSIQREMRNSMIRRESFLDDYCESLVDSKSVFSNGTATTLKPFKKLELAQPPLFVNCSPSHVTTKTTHHTHHYSQSNGRKQTIDSKTKNSLLATLKNMEKESFEN